jgi:hypothetical protein
MVVSNILKVFRGHISTNNIIADDVQIKLFSNDAYLSSRSPRLVIIPETFDELIPEFCI